MDKSKIIIIGRNTLDDDITLFKIGEFFADHRGRMDILDRLTTLDDVDEYDISTKPEKGDAIGHIDATVELVVALHLFGIDQMPGRETYGMDQPYTYCQNNQRLLRICMEHKIPLVVWGDQPWNGAQKQTRIHENMLWIYEPMSFSESLVCQGQ